MNGPRLMEMVLAFPAEMPDFDCRKATLLNLVDKTFRHGLGFDFRSVTWVVLTSGGDRRYTARAEVFELPASFYGRVSP